MRLCADGPYHTNNNNNHHEVLSSCSVPCERKVKFKKRGKTQYSTCFKCRGEERRKKKRRIGEAAANTVVDFTDIVMIIFFLYLFTDIAPKLCRRRFIRILDEKISCCCLMSHTHEVCEDKRGEEKGRSKGRS